MRAPCGTPNGYRAHRRRNEPACDACLNANAARQATYRAAHPDATKSISTARFQALKLLQRAHPVEFRRLYLEQLAALREPK